MPPRFYVHYVKRVGSFSPSCFPCFRHTVVFCLLSYAILLCFLISPRKWTSSRLLPGQTMASHNSGISQPSAITRWSTDHNQRQNYHDKDQDRYNMADTGSESNSKADVEIPAFNDVNVNDFNDDESHGGADDLAVVEAEHKKVKRVIYLNPHPRSVRGMHFIGCSELCQLTNTTKDADMVVFNAAQMNELPSLPEKNPNQIWLMMSREAAFYGRFVGLLRDDVKGVMNWTASIYRDSTFPMTHGQLQKGELPDKDFDLIFERKRFDVAWFVSHCETPSRREEYVRRMTSHIDVHIFGICGNMTCGGRGYTMGGQLGFCMDMLSKDYKFYLAFENALCDDYLTEKFFNLFKAGVDTIPVVRTGADYSHRFPSDIVIDTRDFQSPEKLAKYLKQLSQDKARYIRILKSKSRYTFGRKIPVSCLACHALHDGLPPQVLEDPHNFWGNTSARCHEPRDLD